MTPNLPVSAPRQPTRRADQGSTTGLQPRTAAFLSYLGWWVTGGLMLIVERRDRVARFHAAQSLVSLGAVWLIGALVYVLAFALLSLSAVSFVALLWAALGIWAAGVGLWIVSLVKVFRGEPWRVPLAAGIADRLA